MDEDLISELVTALETFSGEESLKEIFWSILSYDQQRLQLSSQALPGEVADGISVLQLFATHDEFAVIRASCPTNLERHLVDRLCNRLESRFTTVLLVMHAEDVDKWTLIYPDRAQKAHLRFLDIPGLIENVKETARSLASLAAIDWGSEETLRRFDVTERMDVFFPGCMPKQRWEFDASLENTQLSESYLRRKAAPIADLYHAISQYSLLTSQQERGEDLDEDVNSDREMTDYRWRLVLHNMRLVINIALSFPTNVLDIEDIVQEGVLGLITAAKKYDPSRGARFSTYAWYWIRQGIFRAIAHNQNLIRWPVHRISDLVPANRDEDAKNLSPGERYVETWATGTFDAMLPIDEPEEDRLDRIEQIEALNSSIEENLSERQKRIIRLRFGIGTSRELTLEEVGQIEGVTRERIRQIQQKASEKLVLTLPAWLREEYDADIQKNSNVAQEIASDSAKVEAIKDEA